MAEKIIPQKSCCVYWLFDAGCSRPEKDGYIGITNRLKGRLRAHRTRFGVFNVKILFSGTRDECAALEFNLRPHHGIGWNVAQGGKQTKGHLGCKHTLEARAKMGAFRGRKHTPEARAKMGRPMSKEEKEKLRAINTGSKRTEEQRAKMSAAQLGNKKNLGKKLSIATRAKMAASATGRRMSAEAIEKVRKANIGNKYCVGIKHTTEARANMSAAHKGKTIPFEQRAKISAALKGKSKPKGFGAKISELKRGNTYGLGTKRTEETRRKMSEAQRRRFGTLINYGE